MKAGRLKAPPVDYDRLFEARKRSRLGLRRLREERREFTRALVGGHWSEEGSRVKRPVNLLALYVSIIAPALIAKNPRVMLSTFRAGDRGVVKALEQWANVEIERMRLADTLRRVVVDSLFAVGILKVGLATPEDAAVAGWNLRAGQPFAERVDLDDFAFDPDARDFNDAGWYAHRYRCPYDAAKAMGGKDLSPSPSRLINEEGDERVGTLGRGYYGEGEGFEEFVDLWEYYLPRHRLVVTTDDDGKVLRTRRWLGPERGPLLFLGMDTVPGNAMPLAPLQNLYDLDDAANASYRKLMRMVQRTKEVLTYEGSAADDASRVATSDDGDSVKVDNIDRIKNVVFGGQAMQTVLAAATTFKQLFSSIGGNLELLGGRAPQSGTAHQDEMLNQNATAGVAAMQDRVHDLTTAALDSLCWYWHHDPVTVRRAVYRVPGMPDVAAARDVTPEERQRLSWDDMDVRVDLYSMQHQTPQSKLAALNAVVQQTFLPMAALAQQQGVALDLHAYVRLVGRYLDLPELTEIFTLREPPADAPGAGGNGEAGAGMAPSTSRTYTRNSAPQRTQQGDEQMLVNKMLGNDPGGRNGKLEPMGAA